MIVTEKQLHTWGEVASFPGRFVGGGNGLGTRLGERGHLGM